jgi:hypothetical protein
MSISIYANNAVRSIVHKTDDLSDYYIDAYTKSNCICVINTDMYLDDEIDVLDKIKSLAKCKASISFNTEIIYDSEADIKYAECSITFEMKYYRFIFNNVLPK